MFVHSPDHAYFQLYANDCMQLLRTKAQIATFIALLFHTSGFIAIAFFKSQLFINLTALNLFISFALIIWTQEKISVNFFLFILASFTIGFGAEWIGIHKGWLFGNYEYGASLWIKWQGVPWIIGINWFITIYCAAVCVTLMQNRFKKAEGNGATIFTRQWLILSQVIDAATLAVFFDWVLEPVAVKLGYWTWKNGEIPSLNYWSWFGVSALIMIVFKLVPFRTQNLFGLHLLLIQTMFFLLLRFCL